MDMVEKVARAICNELGYDWDNPSVSQFRRTYFRMALASIKAMREPTPEMEKGLQAYLDHLTAYDEPSCNTAYHCMISAALKEQEKVG